MARADGSVAIKVVMEAEQAEKDLAKLKKDIKKTEKTIATGEAKKAPLVAQAEELQAKMKAARAEVERYRKEWASGVVGADRNESAAQRSLEETQAQLDEVTAKINKIDKNLIPAYQEFDEMTEKAGELAKKINSVSSATKAMAKAQEKAAKSVKRFGMRLGAVVRSALIFTVITRALSAFRDWMSKVIKTNDKASAATAKLKGALLTMVQPLIEIIVPAFTTLVEMLTRVVSIMAQLFSQMTGKSVEASKEAAKALHEQTEALDETGKAAKKASGSLAGFDEINKLSGNSESENGGANAPDFSFDASGVANRMQAILGGVLAVGLAISFLTTSTLPMMIAAIAVVVLAFLDANGQIDNAINGIKTVCEGLVDFFVGIFTGDIDRAVGGVGKIFDGLKQIVFAVIDSVSNSFNSFLDWLDEKTGGKLSGVIENVRAYFSDFIFIVKEMFGGLIDAVSKIFEGITKFVSGVFTNDWDMAWEGVKDVFKGVWHGILSILIAVINAIISGVNGMVRQLNKLSFDVPDWVPVIGGGSFGFNIPEIKPIQVPKLAQGAVIPPNREFLAVLGDQRNGTNIEAPLATIKQALLEALRESSSSGGGAYTFVVNLDGREIARNQYKHLRELNRVNG